MATAVDVEFETQAFSEDAARQHHRHVLQAMSGLLVAVFVAILSSTIVANALPTIVSDLGGTASQYTWVVTATLLAATASTPIWGKLADIYSKKRLFQLAVVIFAVGSVLCATATSMSMLIGLRGLQGLGLGGVQAMSQVVMAALVSPRERGRYAGYLGTNLAVATVTGPLIGGLIVGTPWLGWQWCFLVGVPFAIAALLVLQRTLDLPVMRRKVHIDWFGGTLLVGAIAVLLIWVSLAGHQFAWLSAISGGLVGLGVALLATAILVETRSVEPVLPLSLFTNRTVVLAVLASVAAGTAMFSAPVFVGQYLQLGRGLGPTAAGLLTLPLVLGLVLSSTVSGQLVTRTGRLKVFLVLGATTLLTGLVLLSTVDHGTRLVTFELYLALLGLGLGMLLQNQVVAVQNAAPSNMLGSASSTVMLCRSLGGTTGLSVLGAVLATQVVGGSQSATGSLDGSAQSGAERAAVQLGYADGVGVVFGIMAVLALVTVVASVLIRETPLRSRWDVEATGVAKLAPEAAGAPSADPAWRERARQMLDPVDEHRLEPVRLAGGVNVRDAS